MRYSQINEQQKNQIHTLNDQLLKFDEKHQQAQKSLQANLDKHVFQIQQDHKKALGTKDTMVIQEQTEKSLLRKEKD